MQEYVALGHIKLITGEMGLRVNGYYLPHHPVVKESSLTTKLRVVFDASAKISTDLSLNDTLMTGPTIQDDLFSIISRFCTYQYVLTADITKMYRQILIDEQQTVTYGTAPASFLATRSLIQLSEEAQNTQKLGAMVISRDFYMDDLLTGADSRREAINIRNEVRSILLSGGFESHKWASNNESLLLDIPASSETTVLHLDKEETVKTLRLLWNSTQDAFNISIPQFDTSRRITKRTMLSDMSQIFDPLGLINPIVVSAKILMQRLWQFKLASDESVPAEIHTAWFQYRKQLPELCNLHIPRLVMCKNPKCVELHGFCYASESAYGACVYMRAVDKNNTVFVELLASKSTVGPLKTISLPRLELCGALLLSQQIKKLSNCLYRDVNARYCWTDSTIVLSWIKSQSRKWTTFVVNRVGEIQRLTEVSTWSHVRPQENPADIISRESSPIDLIENQLWWNGPSWLCKRQEEWPKEERNPDTEVAEQHRVAANVAINAREYSVVDIERYSSFSRLIRVYAFCRRFYKNCKVRKEDRTSGPLLSGELLKSKLMLTRYVQREQFIEEYNLLNKNSPLSAKSKILCLNPSLDDQDIIRVGGRLKNSALEYSAKHQALLPKGHHFTKLMIRHYHIRQCHTGLEATVAALRREFWPISVRSTTRKLIQDCVTCFRVKSSIQTQKMANLSKHRLIVEKPFYNCGIDYCGPFYYKQSIRRNAPVSKAYAAIFVCCATTVVHLELVSSLSTMDFIAALKRFMSRRGKINNMFSDNGTNFVGANIELKQLQRAHKCDYSKMVDAFAEDGFKWSFIPPYSPHFGGLWEAIVKSVKYHLRRAAGNASLTFEELYTLLVQIEGILNSRSISAMSSDPNDFAFLTPGHFLIGDAPTAIPEPNLRDTPINRFSRWQRIQLIRQH